MQASRAINKVQLEDRLSSALVDERLWLVRHCAALTGARTDAEDLAQETLLEAWRAREKLRDIEAIRPWLSAIARNVCLRHRRRAGQDHSHLLRYDPDTLGASEMLADDTPFGLTMDDSDAAEVLNRALATLPSFTRQALEAVYIQERPQTELAKALQISEAA